MFIRDEVIAKKEALRAEMKARRTQCNESQRARASWLLSNRLAAFLETRPPGIIGVYLSTPSEISLDSLIGTLLHQGLPVAAPRIDLETRQMSFWRLHHLEEVELGPWNVRQPPATEPAEELSLIIVPGLAFDPCGGRLGTGGGWYDRFLQSTDTAIGVGFDCQIVPEVPLEPHDFRVNYVASEERWFEVT